MGTKFWLTDEDSDIAGYKRAKLGARSDACSMVRAVTSTAQGPITIPITRQVGGVPLVWLSDPLNGPSIAELPWEFHLWSVESSTDANVSLKVEVKVFTNTVNTNLLSETVTPGLNATVRDVAYTTIAASDGAILAEGNRLLFSVSLVDTSAFIAPGYTATLSYNGQFAYAEGDSYVESPDEIGLPNEIPQIVIESLRTNLRDDGDMEPQLDDLEISMFIEQAVRSYSQDSPMTIGYYYTGNGQSYDFPLPPKWVLGFSRVVAIELPTTTQVPSRMEDVEFEIREGMLGPQPTRILRLHYDIPDSTADSFFLQYTTVHHFSDRYSTIPANDFDALIWLATSIAASALASKGAGSTDSTIAQDSTNYRDMEARWGSVARRYMDLYLGRIVSPNNATPTGTNENWDSRNSVGQPFLFHNWRRRRNVS